MGMFLAIEGPKGVGKTTVTGALRQRMGSAHADQVILTKEPTPGFDLSQESQLLGADLARAIAQDRSLHVEDVIRPALSAGSTIICDRYILSSLVFHTADGVTPEEIWRLNDPFPFPDVNLILTASAEIISSRRAQRTSRTRLEAGSDPSAELDRYIHFGQEMQARGTALKIMSNESTEHLAQAVEWIMHSIRDGISS
jgi:dTMP kinase